MIGFIIGLVLGFGVAFGVFRFETLKTIVSKVKDGFAWIVAKIKSIKK